MLRRHSRRQLARLGELPDRKSAGQHHLDHPQAMGMGQHAEALGGLRQRIEAGQLRKVYVLCHRVLHTYNISEYSELSRVFLQFQVRFCLRSGGLRPTAHGPGEDTRKFRSHDENILILTNADAIIL